MIGLKRYKFENDSCRIELKTMRDDMIRLSISFLDGEQMETEVMPFTGNVISIDIPESFHGCKMIIDATSHSDGYHYQKLIRIPHFVSSAYKEERFPVYDRTFTTDEIEEEADAFMKEEIYE